MPPRRTGRKRAPSKALLHLDAPKASKARKIAPVPKDSIVSKDPIVLSSEAEVFSPPTLSDVEDLSLLRLNSLKTPQLNPLKISQTSQAVNVNALISSELVIFVAKTAATLCYERTKAEQGWSSNQFAVNASEFSA